MTFQNILIEKNNRIATITINRPNQLNALNKETIQALSDALTQLENDSEVRVIILTGAGEKAFVAGADIKEFVNFDVEQGKELAANGQHILFDKIENLTKPVIAAINGFALGGGLELAMACHVRLASNDARLGLPETSLGVIPGYGGTQRLAQLAGKGKAMEMILTARMVTADEAQQYGLVNQVVEKPALMEAAQKMAASMIKNSPRAQAEAMKAILAGYRDGVNGFEAEIKAFGECFQTEEFKEGTSAFLEKRKANF